MSLRPVIFLLVLIAAKADPLDALVADAPFRRMAEGAAISTNGLVLRGVFRLGDRHFLSVLDPATGTARWLAEGEERSGLKVMGYNPATKIAKVQVSGRTESLRLMPAENRSK